MYLYTVSLYTLYLTNNLVITLVWGLIEKIVEFHTLGGLFFMRNLNSFVKHGCKQQNHRSDFREHRKDFVVGIWGSPSGLFVSKLKV